jgi:hypothetical protein
MKMPIEDEHVSPRFARTGAESFGEAYFESLSKSAEEPVGPLVDLNVICF